MSQTRANPLPWVLIFFVRSAASISSVQLLISNTTADMYNNGVYSNQFLSSFNQFSCSLNNLFTYRQSYQSLINNSPYQLTITGVTQTISLAISTQYQVLAPSLSATSCNSDCTIQIRNYCPDPLSIFRYFDTIVLNIQGLSTFTYNVICNRDFKITTFQAGLFIIVIACFIIILLTAIFNKAWAFQTKGFEVTYTYIALYAIMQAIGGTLIVVDPTVAQIVGDVSIWFIGTFGIIICSNQLLFKLRIQKIKTNILNIKKVRIRITDVISFFIAVGLLLGWILSNKNWIISNVISLCVMIGTIKIFKITSFKKGLILYLIEVFLQIIFVVLIEVLEKISYYQEFLLNDFNNPLIIQLPTINPQFGLKCSWLPISVTIFPGILFAYFHRFDNSRNTKIYLITSSVAFFIGAIVWIVINSLSKVSIPFQPITGPLMLTLVVMFAYNRKQIKVLWNGKFYDAQFKNQEEYDEQTYNYEMETKNAGINEDFLDGLKFNKKDQESEDYSEQAQPSLPNHLMFLTQGQALPKPQQGTI